MFTEAEQATVDEYVDKDDAGVPTLPDIGLPELDKPELHERGGNPLPANLKLNRIEYALQEVQKFCPCCSKAIPCMGKDVNKLLHMEAQTHWMSTDVLKGQKNKPSPRTTKALEFFHTLYQVAALVKQTLLEDERPADYQYRLRQRHSVPLLADFGTWLDELAPKVLPKRPLGEAIGYCRRQ
ncbi:hypothetical protein WM04_20710 [Burkholderia ubonensis]|nr:hypothetical protein WM04_20710 [Burkholderia ubonensis]